MLLKGARIPNSLIAHYVKARCEREVGVAGVQDVPIEILDMWAKELDIPTTPEQVAQLSPRRLHINATLALFKEWKSAQAASA